MPDELDNDIEQSSGLEVVPAEPILRRPSLYQLIMLNDDYTPREFVVGVLERFFGMPQEKAFQIMMAVHRTGRAVVGIFTRDVAEMKSTVVNQFAQDNEYPLKTLIEETDAD